MAMQADYISLDDGHPPDTRTQWLLVGIAAAFVLLQLAVTLLGSYGYFIDEFYYIACARRPALGYVDHPPLAPLVLAAIRLVFGESILAIRFPAFLLGGVAVWAAGRLALEFHGGRWAAAATAVTVALAPGVLAMSGFFSVNIFELVAWVVCTWAFVRLIKTDDSRWWLVIGLAAGLGFESKHTMSTLLVALGAGILVTPARRLLMSRWAVDRGVDRCRARAAECALAAGERLPITGVLPSGGTRKERAVSPARYANRAGTLHGPIDEPCLDRRTPALVDDARGIALPRTGNRVHHPARVAGVLETEQARSLARDLPGVDRRGFRVARNVPAIAGLSCDRSHRGGRRMSARHAHRDWCAAAGTLARYTAWLGISTSGERGKRPPPIPQLLADRTGWEDFVAQVARIYEQLPPQDKAHTLIYAPSYGQAGAVDVLGRQFTACREPSRDRTRTPLEST